MFSDRAPTAQRNNSLLFGAVMVDAVGVGFFLPISLLVLIRHNGLDSVDAGAAVTVGALVAICTIPSAGQLVGRLGPRRGLQTSNLLSAVGAGLYLVAYSSPLAAVASFVGMFGDKVYGAAWPALVASMFGRDRVGSWLATANAVRTGAVAIGSIAATVLLASGSTRALTWAVVANIASKTLSMLAVAWLRSEKWAPLEKTSFKDVLEPLANRSFMRLLTGQTLLSVAWAVTPVVFPLLLVAGLGLPVYWATVVLAVRYGVIALLQIPIRKATNSWSDSTVMGTTYVLVLASLILCSVMLSSRSHNFAVTGSAALIAVVGIALAEILSKPAASQAAVLASPPGREIPFMAVFQLSWTLSYAAAPLLVGVGVETPLFMWVALILLVGAGGFVQLIPQLKEWHAKLR
ncbi:MFS transporter [Arthrobacter sp. StoSoilB5]|nr:MFS transporter [Arthrobacter sp. StoSoilB5]